MSRVLRPYICFDEILPLILTCVFCRMSHFSLPAVLCGVCVVGRFAYRAASEFESVANECKNVP